MRKAGGSAAIADQDQPLELFAQAPDVAAGTKEDIIHLALDSIDVDPANPRTDADDELAESIRQEGVLQPITVRPHPDSGNGARPRYMIVFGERRYRGSLKAGRKTIPAIIRGEANADRAHRLVRQFQENFHKKLNPLQEAALLKEVRDATKFSTAQLAKISGKPKSTIEDRLALADAPAPFQPLFASGALTAAAAPIIRQFAAVPVNLLEQAVERASDWGTWSHSIDTGKPIPLRHVESTLSTILIGDNWRPGILQEIPNALALVYQGPKVTMGKKEYAADLQEFGKLAKVHAKELEAERRAKEKKAQRRSPASTSSEAQRKADAQHRKQLEIEAAKRKADAARWRVALPTIREQLVAGIKSSAVAHLIASVDDRLRGEFYFDKGDEKRAEALLPRGKTAESFLRFILVCHCESDIEGTTDDGFHSSAPSDRAAIADVVKDLRLKVDLKRLLAAADQQITDATKAEAAKTKVAAAAKKLVAKARGVPRSKKKLARQPDFLKPVQPDAVLAVIVGNVAQPRTDITKKVWAYIKKHGLQDKKERRMINADAALKAVFGGKQRLNMFEMTKAIAKHFSPAKQ